MKVSLQNYCVKPVFGANHIADSMVSKIDKEGNPSKTEVSLVEFMPNNKHDMEALNYASLRMTPYKLYSSHSIGVNSHVFGLVEGFKQNQPLNSSGVEILGLVETTSTNNSSNLNSHIINNIRVIEEAQPRAYSPLDIIFGYRQHYEGVGKAISETIQSTSNIIPQLPIKIKELLTDKGLKELKQLHEYLHSAKI